jgi:acyl-CoA synthetase (AMP-forming)/AMP-acid ligase II
LSSWRLAFCGSEPIRASTLATFSERLAGRGFAPSALFPCYGLAEATLYVSGVKPGAGMRVDPETSLVSCGSTAPEHAIAIVEPNALRVLPAGSPGEICVSGPSVAQGYFRNEAATAAAFVSLEGRRYLRTGDLGFVRDGELYISGRLKDLVIVRGRNIVPQDVEDHLAHHVGPLQVGRVAVFAVQTEEGEAVGVAAEVSRAAARSMRPELLCRAIAAAVHECVQEPARLVALLSQGALPRTSSGKLKRGACAEQLRSGELRALAVHREDAAPLFEVPASRSLEAR